MTQLSQQAKSSYTVTQLVFQIRADVRPPSLAGIDRQLLQFCFYYKILIAVRLFQADSYIGIEFLW